MSILSKAKLELDILIKSCKNDGDHAIVEDFVPEILALIDKFAKSGQSGGSAPYTAKALSDTIEKLCLQNPLCDITGVDDEWCDVSHLGDGSIMFQNKRLSSIFKNGKNNKPYYLDAIIWVDERGLGWTGNAYIDNNKIDSNKILSSRQYIKSFPFKPKTFRIDVISHEVEKDNWEFEIKNAADLSKVFDYYDHE